VKVHSFILAFLLACGLSGKAEAADVLPQAVQSQVQTPLVSMGSSTYRKFGFSIYRVTLWTTDGTWNKQKPYALELRYTRDLSKDTLVDNVTDDLRDEKVASDATVDGWHQILDSILTDVQEDDTIVSLYLPKKEKSPLFHNEKVILWTSDEAFVQAFFGIWLGQNADEDMRKQLLMKL
jgi:hypothetical protein